MKKVYQFLATGFEEVEALIPLDVLKRGGVDCTLVSVEQSREVTSSHGVRITADMTISEANLDDADMLLLPGGMPGSVNLGQNAAVRAAIDRQNKAGELIGAICAAPMVLGEMGLLQGKKATCYPGFEEHLLGADYTAGLVEQSGNIVTGRGPAAAFPYAYHILSILTDKETAEQVRDGMIFTQLMSQK